MNCEEVQAQLPDYLERSVDAEKKFSIDEHLAECTGCRVETELLGECIRQVAALPIVEPPLGFVQRVMAHAREIETRPGLWQRLLLPLRTKVPIQATALVMVGILGIYLLQKEKPHEQIKTEQEPKSDNAIEKNAPATKSEITDFAKRSADQTATPPKEQSAPSLLPAAPRQSAALENRTPATENQATKFPVPAPVSSPDVARPTRVNPLSQDRRVGNLRPAPEPGGNASATISGTPIATRSSSQVSGSPTPFFSPFESDTGAALRPVSPAIEPFADYELVLRRHHHETTDPRGGVGERRERLETSRQISEPQPTPRAIERLMNAIPDHTRPQTIWITVPSSQYEKFKLELQYLGTIQSESRVPLWRDNAPSQSDGQIRVKLTALPAVDRPGPETPYGEQR